MTSALQRFLAAPVHEVQLDAATVAYRRFGHGPAVVMVHGWPLSGITYRGLIDLLQDRFTCYVPDLPGAGDTPWDPSMRELFTDGAAIVRQFVDTLALDRFALIGHDSGGAIARIAAAELPQRVTAMVLTNTETPGHQSTLVRAFQILASIPGAATAFSWLLRSPGYCRSALGFGGTFADRDLIDGEFRDTAIAPLLRDMSGPIAALRSGDLGIVHRLAEIHAKITAPLLCIWGDKDPFFPLRGAEDIVRQWAGPAALEVVPGKKLLVHEETPSQVAALARPFLTEHAGEGKVHAVGA